VVSRDDAQIAEPGGCGSTPRGASDLVKAGGREERALARKAGAAL